MLPCAAAGSASGMPASKPWKGGTFRGKLADLSCRLRQNLPGSGDRLRIPDSLPDTTVPGWTSYGQVELSEASGQGIGTWASCVSQSSAERSEERRVGK